MPINVRYAGDVVVLSNFARLVNDPRHFDAAHEVRGLLDEGRRHFVLELVGLRETGATVVGLLTTLTRLIRQYGGEAVLARPARNVEAFLEEMRLDAYWDVFESVEEAQTFLERPGHRNA